MNTTLLQVCAVIASIFITNVSLAFVHGFVKLIFNDEESRLLAAVLSLLIGIGIFIACIKWLWPVGT